MQKKNTHTNKNYFVERIVIKIVSLFALVIKIITLKKQKILYKIYGKSKVI